MRSKKLILFVANQAQYFMAHWLRRAQAARAEGYEVHVAVQDSEAVGKLREEGFVVHLIPLQRRGMNPIKEIFSLGALVNLYRKLRPDLVHHLTIKPVLYGGLAARLTRTPAVVSAITGLGYVFTQHGVFAFLLRKAVTFGYRFAMGHPCIRVTFENPDDRAQFVKHRLISERNSVWIKGAGVDISEFAPTSEHAGPPLVVLASRLLWDKGVGEFVDSARELRNAGVSARFVLVGDTDPDNPSGVPREQLELWKEKGAVEWWGWRQDIPYVLEQAHIVCLPSYYREGIPRILIEAAACGRPIVTTDLPGCREAVRDGESGLIVPARNVGRLASALRRLIDDAELRKKMGLCGRKIAESEFAEAKIIRHTLDVYQELFDQCVAC